MKLFTSLLIIQFAFLFTTLSAHKQVPHHPQGHHPGTEAHHRPVGHPGGVNPKGFHGNVNVEGNAAQPTYVVPSNDGLLPYPSNPNSPNSGQ